MKKICLSLLFFSFTLVYCEPKTLIKEDISQVMDRFFTLHVEVNEITPEIIKRSFKVYIEKFDPERMYLLEREALPYLTMSTYKAKKIMQRYNKGDFSDYEALNNLMEKAVIRSRHSRVFLAKEMLERSSYGRPLGYNGASFAKNEQDLQERLKSKMLGFIYQLAQKYDLSSIAKKEKALLFFERKIAQYEKDYCFEKDLAQKEHYFTLHVLKALSKSLDPHTTFFSEEEANQMRMSLLMHFQGVGVVLSEGFDGVIVTDLIKGGPAELSGQIQVDDLLVEIDGKEVTDLSFQEVMELMKGDGNSKIHLGFMRSGTKNQNNEFLRVMLEKQPIVLEDDRIKVSYDPYANGIVGKITLKSFYESDGGPTSEKDIRRAITELESKGPLLGLVLDLRENAGGFLSQAVKVAGLFIKSGVVVISKYANNETHYLRTLDGKTAYNGPLVILTSKLSASAAEITAQALQDYGVALVVGDSRTFGKGTIQYQTVTDRESDLFFKVTVGKYYTPSGKTTQQEGVQADIVVPSVFSPYLIGEKYLEYSLKNDEVDPALKDNLSDLDPKAKIIFEKYYLPNLQRVITIWQKMLPTLKKNSENRLATDENFQSFLKRQKMIEAKMSGIDVDVLQQAYGLGDLQMDEAVNILKDMIFIEAKQKDKAKQFSFFENIFSN